MRNLHPESQYYLHINGTVHYKPHGDVDSASPFVRAVWNANTIGKTPESYLEWLKELKELGVKESEISRLIKKQNLEDFIPQAKEILKIDSGA